MKRLIILILSLLVLFFVSLVVSFFFLLKPLTVFYPFKDYLLGTAKPTTYLFLLGNDTEMRANGGFAGSYAKITLSYPNSQFDFQDIYVPNGQLKGHVTPPDPIQQAFGHGTWELANADWDPDFPSAAKSLRWFFEKGGEINPDILGIINLTTIKKILSLIGPFPVPDYKAQITPENLYLFLQGKAEVNFFPGSTQKKDALTAVGSALIKKFRSLPFTQKIRIIKHLYQDFQNQNLVIHSQNQDFQNLLENLNLAGSLHTDTLDYYSLSEVNLGANKSNQFVTRHTTHQVSFAQNQIHHQVTVNFHNSSPEENPNPPIHYGGNYITYLRFYLPLSSQNTALVITHNPPEASLSASPSALFSEKLGFREIGFWHTTKANTESTISLTYSLPLTNPSDYSLKIQKQNGLPSSPQSGSILNRSFSTNLERHFFYP